MSILSEIGTKIGTEIKDTNARVQTLETSGVSTSSISLNCDISDQNTAGTYGGSGVCGLYEGTSKGNISFAADKVTIQETGTYFVSAQQLNILSGAQYFRILKNGTVVNHGYSATTGTHIDLIINKILYLSAGDYIQMSYSTTSSNRWTSSHSNLSIFMI